MRSTVTKRSAKGAKKAARDRRTVTERRKASAATRKGWATRRKAAIGKAALDATFRPDLASTKTRDEVARDLAAAREPGGGAGAVAFGAKVTKPELVTISKRLERVEHDLGVLVRRDLPLADPSRITGVGLVDPAAEIKAAARATMTAPADNPAGDRERQVPFIGFSIERANVAIEVAERATNRIIAFLHRLYGEDVAKTFPPAQPAPAPSAPDGTVFQTIAVADRADQLSTRLVQLANLLPEAP